MRPRILQADLDPKKFNELPKGYQKIFLSQDAKDELSMTLPIVGYSGHRKGEKSENVFAQSFRHAAMFAETRKRNKI